MKLASTSLAFLLIATSGFAQVPCQQLSGIRLSSIPPRQRIDLIRSGRLVYVGGGRFALRAMPQPGQLTQPFPGQVIAPQNRQQYTWQQQVTPRPYVQQPTPYAPQNANTQTRRNFQRQPVAVSPNQNFVQQPRPIPTQRTRPNEVRFGPLPNYTPQRQVVQSPSQAYVPGQVTVVPPAGMTSSQPLIGQPVPVNGPVLVAPPVVTQPTPTNSGIIQTQGTIVPGSERIVTPTTQLPSTQVIAPQSTIAPTQSVVPPSPTTLPQLLPVPDSTTLPPPLPEQTTPAGN